MCVRLPIRWCALLTVLCVSSPAQPAPVAEKQLPTLTTAHAIHSLTSVEAARAYPVRLHAVVTYYDPYIDARHGAMFVHDATGSVFVNIPARRVLAVQAGDAVELEGVSGAGDYAPVVDDPHMRAEGHSHVPDRAAKATIAELQTGSMDGQWVEVTGVVRSVQLTDRNAMLEVVTASGPISAITLREPGKDYDVLVDALVRIHGNAGPIFNRRRQMVGVHLFFPTLRELKVVQSAPQNPFALPPLALRHLLQFNPGLKLARRVHVQGRVTLLWPGRILCIQQGSDGLCMQTFQTNWISAGETVDVAGFPAASAFKATLDNPTFHFAGGTAVALKPVPITAEEALRGDHDGQLVRLEGELIGRDRATGDLTLMLRAGNFLIPAILAAGPALPEVVPWQDGSIVRVTGVCSVMVDRDSSTQGPGEVRAESVRILLRSIDDVEVLQVPTWWTTAHALETVAGALAAAFAAFAWVFVLRRRVERQTRALRESEERLRHLSYYDPLTGLPNRMLFNDRLEVALNRTDRFKMSVGLLMMDLDRFKEVNDSLGHQAGDELLCQIAARIQGSIRKTDTAARFGGDEFLVLLPDLRDREQAGAIAAKIVQAVRQPVLLEAGCEPISISVGVATWPDGGTDAESLLQHADAAMYQAKALGGNGVCLYGSAKISPVKRGCGDYCPAQPVPETEYS